MSKKIFANITFCTLLLVFAFRTNTYSEEGMFPLSEIRNLDLKKMGFNISVDELYNPQGTSLITALVNLSGCTGSFVSQNGLILTNHHCSFSAISGASTIQNNYLENGFTACTLEEEIEAKGMSAKIIESYQDVSSIILQSIETIKDNYDRKKSILAKIKELEEVNSDEDNDITAEVAEMLAGKSYILFKYKKIKDVRLVYAPPQSIGNFGGEDDNWIWPRHTGDFTFLRAYVAPDGSSKTFSKDNVPYNPKKWLQINASGLKENDFAFILGYPGKTYRHQPSKFIEYQYNYLLPNVSLINNWLIDQFEDISKDNDSLKLKYASTVRSLANTMKNYRGKLFGLKKLNFVEKKIFEEKELINYINSDSTLSFRYKNMFTEIADVYKKIDTYALAEILIVRLLRYSNIYNTTYFLFTYPEEMKKPNNERQTMYKETNLPISLTNFNLGIENINPELEKRIFIKALIMFKDLDSNSILSPLVNFLQPLKTKKDIEDYVNTILTKDNSLLFTLKDSLLSKTTEQIISSDDKLLNLCYRFKLLREEIKKQNDEQDGYLSRLLPQLVEIKMLKDKSTFIPDGNGTLRLTYGHIVGYSPADAVYYSPFTTLNGIIEKSYKGNLYKIPEQLYDLNKTKKENRFFDKDLNDIPVAFLYNMDTTGGNSGSPVFNSFGQLIGLNYDRAFEATINDFTYSSTYSRSIGVDIRYILYITKNLGNANNILKELNIE
ncbi:MAG: S46 family peptidase [bacterium]